MSKEVTQEPEVAPVIKPKPRYTRVPSQSVQHHITVDGVWFYSVKQAFIDLNLPYAKHIAFRLRLKSADNGMLQEYGMNWEMTTLKKEKYYGQTQNI